MQIKIILSLIILSIVSINLVNSQLIINPNNLSINTLVGQKNTYYLNLTNNFNFQIQRLYFTDLTDFNFGEIGILNPNESKMINISVKTSTSYSKTINSKVGFFYVVDIPTEITTYNVNITENGFSPINLTIRQGDTVIWHNYDDISHTATGSNFNLNIQPNSAGSHLFNTLGTFSYQDLNMFFGGDINVINRTTPNYVHNQAYDKDLLVSIDSTSNPTNITASVNYNNFTVSIAGTDTVKGTLLITNNGNQVAEKVSISDSLGWLKFDETEFNIPVGQSQPYPVTFKIQPHIISTNDTDKTYNMTIRTKALNSMESNVLISVYIPYSNIFDINDSSNIGYINYLMNVFCPIYPTSFLCNQSIGNCTTPQIVYRDPNITVSDTVSEWNAMKKKLQQLLDSGQRSDNSLTTLADTFGMTVPELKILLNQSMEKQINNEKRTNDWLVYFLLTLFFVVVVAIIIIVVRKIQNKSKVERILKDG